MPHLKPYILHMHVVNCQFKLAFPMFESLIHQSETPLVPLWFEIFQWKHSMLNAFYHWNVLYLHAENTLVPHWTESALAVTSSFTEYSSSKCPRFPHQESGLCLHDAILVPRWWSLYWWSWSWRLRNITIEPKSLKSGLSFDVDLFCAFLRIYSQNQNWLS